MNWAMVSAVAPDLLMTLQSVRLLSSRSSSGAMVAGSTLSSTYSRGKYSRCSSFSSFQNGGLSACRSASVPRADPPMPSTSTLSTTPAAASAKVRISRTTWPSKGS
jgi:hypothetical protein